MLLKYNINNVYRFVRIVHVTHPLDEALVRPSLSSSQLTEVLPAAVETETLNARLLSVDFSWYLKDFLVEFGQVVLLQDPVNALENAFK